MDKRITQSLHIKEIIFITSQCEFRLHNYLTFKIVFMNKISQFLLTLKNDYFLFVINIKICL